MASLHRFPRFYLFGTGTGDATVGVIGGGLGFVESPPPKHTHVDRLPPFVDRCCI